MEDETKDYSELDFDNTKELSFEKTKEVKDETLLSVSDQIKKIKKEEIDDKIEELKSEQNNNKKLNTTLIILVSVFSILFILLLCYLLFSNKEDDIKKENNTSLITRPSNNLEYIILKQNGISLICNKTDSGEKIKVLKKGMIIECDFTINTTESINELYFDLENSSNLKLKSIKNDTNHELINDKNTYKLTTTSPLNVLKDKIKLYYEVTDISEKTGYAEIKNIVFVDNKNYYYKMTDNIFAFPPEYDDKIFIYKQTIDEEEQYIGSKAKLNDNNLELIYTYNCSSEECEVKDNFKSSFVIYDKTLVVYDVIAKTKQTVKIADENFDYTKYEYETISNKEGNLIGLLFKKDYKENLDCDAIADYCIEKSISGFDVSYYSFESNMFTVALDYGFVGSNIYSDYDIGLLLMKNNKFGVFSYEEDAMVLELSKNYTSIEYESDMNLVKLGIYDSKKKQNYYTYFNLNNNSFKLDINDNYESINNSKKIYYISETNIQGNTIYMLYNSKGNILKDIPYVEPNNIEVLTDKTLVINNNDNFDIYDLNGNFIETSEYIQSGLKVLKRTSSYRLATNVDNELIITNQIGKTIATIMPSTTINETYEIDTMKIEKFTEVADNLEIIITNPNITEENKNAYQFNVDSSGKVTMEYTYFETKEQ